jgi:hypothetical protein
MKNITYIFGAGASANCLPVVIEMPDRILELIGFLKSQPFSLGDGEFDSWRNTPKSEVFLLLLSDLEWIYENSKNHQSIDTFAKKLMIMQKWKELSRLKRALSVFFVFEQFRKRADPRYDGFFASIIKQRIDDFPANIKILSWNYDYQFEITFKSYSGDSRVIGNTTFPIYSKFTNNNSPASGFALYKLNGTASFVRDGTEYTYFNYFKDNCDNEAFLEILRNYAAAANLINRLNSALSFAFETDLDQTQSILNTAIEATNNTDVLVVIGYSFPFFNREFDRKLINSMEKLEKIYIQSPDASNVAERIEAVRDKLNPPRIVEKNDTSQFLLPNEL